MFIGSAAEATYYNVVRSTLHALDGVRLSAAVSGLTVCTGFLLAAITMIHYVGTVAIFSTNIPVGQILSIIFCYIAAEVANQFIRKIDMFSHFIACSVEVALNLEEKFVPDENLQLTTKFNKHEHAGDRGDKLFKRALKLIMYSAWTGVIISFIATVYEIYKEVTCIS